MKNYTDIIMRKFPQDDKLGFYVKPNIPAVKLGKALAANTRISNPNDVIAFFQGSGFLSNSVIAFTGTTCFHDKGSFLLEDVRDAEANGTDVMVRINQAGALAGTVLNTKSEQAAKIIANLLYDLIYVQQEEEQTPKDYSSFSKEAIPWLELRDEVIKTIDMLYKRYEDGKISLLDYEDKKLDLLSRL